jgi:2-oxo-4-hydroxy-4-carboxy-5-ureidoimidazoline decarboxylase
MTSGWLAGLNLGADDEALTAELITCCSSREWVDRVLAQRPFADAEALLAASDAAIAALDGVALSDALAGHPRIGERRAGAEGVLSQQEQAGVTSAAAGVLEQIAKANADYEQRFGQVYLVCATGRSAEELLAICRSRLGNDPDTETAVIRVELAKITRIRLGRLLRAYDAP